MIQETEERAQFMLGMRARGIRDLALLRALERAPRALFMPQRYADMAARDIALPIGFGQTSTPPSVVATMMQALEIRREHRVLEIGSGTGYASSLLAQLAARVHSVERSQGLAIEAEARLRAFGIANVELVWAEASGLSATPRRYDRVCVHALIDAEAPGFLDLLTDDGIMVGVVASGEGQIVTTFRRSTGGSWASKGHGPARAYLPLVAGLACAA